MKFKATISTEGMKALHKRFLPCLEKFGPTCIMLLTPQNVFLLQGENDANGMLVSARIDNECIFEPGKLTLVSKNDNKIAISISIHHFLQAIRTAFCNEAGSLDIRLSTRSTNPSTQQIGTVLPILVMNWEADGLKGRHELEIGKPITSIPELQQIDSLCSENLPCSFYIDVTPELRRITACAEKLEKISTNVRLSLVNVDPDGDVHLSAETPLVSLGEGFPSLTTFRLSHNDSNNQENIPTLTSIRMEDRLREAKEKKSVISALIAVKLLIKSLATAAPTRPNKLLCGIRSAEEIYNRNTVNINTDNDDSSGGAGTQLGGSFVHLVFVFEDMLNVQGEYLMHLYYKLPLIEEDDMLID